MKWYTHHLNVSIQFQEVLYAFQTIAVLIILLLSFHKRVERINFAPPLWLTQISVGIVWQAAVSSPIWLHLTLLDAFLGGCLTDCTRCTKVHCRACEMMWSCFTIYLKQNFTELLIKPEKSVDTTDLPTPQVKVSSYLKHLNWNSLWRLISVIFQSDYPGS